MAAIVDDISAVPVTIVTGFLGSGKTTLLNHILTGDHGRRIAVIENEFGDEVGIERLIARDGQGGDAVALDDLFVELSNGCVCCAVRDDLVTTLEGLLERRARTPFEHIIIETSGLADPGPLASIFWLDEELESRIFLDAIVTVVDLVHLERHLDDERKRPTEGVVNEALSQLAYADVVLVNKCDLVLSKDLERVAQRVRSINGLARQLRTEYSRVKLSDILDVRAFDASLARGTYERLLEASANAELCSGNGNTEEEAGDTGARGCSACVEGHCSDAHAAEGTADHHSAGHCHVHEHTNGHAHGHHVHDDSVRSVVVHETRCVDLTRLRHWLGRLLWEEEGGADCQIFRIKGVVHAVGEECLYLLQAVHETFEACRVPDHPEDGRILSSPKFVRTPDPH